MKPIIQYTLDGKTVKKWPSTAKAVRSCGGVHPPILACAHGRAASAFGYVWLFDEEGRTPEEIFADYAKGRTPYKYSPIPLLQCSPDGEVLASWPSAKAAARAVGGSHSAILKNARGETKTAYGYVWKYEDTRREHVDTGDGV